MDVDEKTGSRGLKRRAFYVAIAILAALGIFKLWDEVPWMAALGTWRIIGAKFTPMTSAYYELNVRNLTNASLIVDVEVLNDRPFEIFGPRASYFRIRTGFDPTRTFEIQPSSTQKVVLPSHRSRKLGIVIVTARSQYSGMDDMNLSQRVAIYLLDGQDLHAEKISETGTRVIPLLEIEESDLAQLSEEMEDAPLKNVDVHLGKELLKE